MGYRALLKSYIRHLMRVANDHYIDGTTANDTLSKRDVAELRLLVAEVERDDDRTKQNGSADGAAEFIPPRGK